ncbi:hypothetical protein [Longispora albida]|uniref:hypothetical protein n=1 Tax=Longispora albida TaxID=203523 RepID=UPI000381F03E|nr:hypothetical protein [Longispora albida]
MKRMLAVAAAGAAVLGGLAAPAAAAPGPVPAGYVYQSTYSSDTYCLRAGFRGSTPDPETGEVWWNNFYCLTTSSGSELWIAPSP